MGVVGPSLLHQGATVALAVPEVRRTALPPALWQHLHTRAL